MPIEPSTNFCPYRGLQPFTEEDRAYFFGREHDTEIIIANLYAAALTVLYGASGAGKSSVLLAGVVPELKRLPRVAIVVMRKWQDEQFYESLKDEIRAAASAAAGRPLGAASGAGLDDLLLDAAAAMHGRIFLIFDQFEEYFLYHATSSQTQQFEAELARAVNRQDVAANFLFSMRDDGLSRLDRFEGRIPHLLSNMLRLEHLDPRGARDAIGKPLEVFSRQYPQTTLPTAIEDSLAAALLEEARPGTFEAATDAVSGTAQSHGLDSTSDRIETPLLQMVLFRLWKEESAEGSRVMRLSTFERVGRARGIAHTHVDDAMRLLSPAESDLAARMLRFLVTPSGAKIAQQAAALSAWSDLDDTHAMEQVLNTLASPEMRILRRVEIAGQPLRFELFHDVLGVGVLDWRRRYVEEQSRERIRRQEQERRQQEEARIRRDAEERREREAEALAKREQEQRARRLRRALAALAGVVVIIAALAGLAAWQARIALRASEVAREERDKASTQEQIATDQRRLAEERLNRIVAGMALKRAVLSETLDTLPDEVTKAPIRFGARAVPYGYTNQAGQPVYRFDLFPVAESVPGGLQTVAFITYKMAHPTFRNSLLFTGPSQDRTRNFVASYDGWGCLRQVIAVVDYTDPDKPAAAAVFDMCQLLGW